jgi:hypothetical protein
MGDRMSTTDAALAGKVALVAGAHKAPDAASPSRSARLATVYCTGRSTRGQRPDGELASGAGA